MSIQLLCQECQYGEDDSRRGRGLSVSCDGNVELTGVMTCLADLRRMPIAMRGGFPISLGMTLPIEESQNLQNVPGGIVQDVKEAESAHFAQCLKASAVLCRRALQLALEEYLGLEGITLGPLLQKARKSEPPLLSPQEDVLAERVKSLGDAGAHSTAALSPKQVEVAIFDTVTILNGLYKKQRPSK